MGWYQLLFVTKQTTKDISTNTNLIQIAAITTQFAPQLKTGAEFLQATSAFLKGYFILFVFASPDTSKLDELQATMNSIRLVDPTH